MVKAPLAASHPFYYLADAQNGQVVMVRPMKGGLVAFGHQAFRQLSMFLGAFGQDEEGCPDPPLLEQVEDLGGDLGVGPIVEGESDDRLAGLVLVIDPNSLVNNPTMPRPI